MKISAHTQNSHLELGSLEIPSTPQGVIGGDSMLNWIMVQCTRIHVRWCSDSAITKFYEQVSARRGDKVAIVAAARKLMRAIYIMLKDEQTFRLDG